LGNKTHISHFVTPYY